jgi:hypothetical protein
MSENFITGGGGGVWGDWIYFEYWEDLKLVYNNNREVWKPFRAKINFSLDSQHNCCTRSENPKAVLNLFKYSYVVHFYKKNLWGLKHSFVTAVSMQAWTAL